MLLTTLIKPLNIKSNLVLEEVSTIKPIIILQTLPVLKTQVSLMFNIILYQLRTNIFTTIIKYILVLPFWLVPHSWVIEKNTSVIKYSS